MRKFSLLLFFLPLFSIAQVESAKRAVEQLCSPEFHGRGYVNSGDSIAAEFIAKGFKDAGCRFFQTGPFQAFQFQVNAFPGNMSLSIDGKVLNPGTDFVVDPGSCSGKTTNRKFIEISVEDLFNTKNIKNKLADANMQDGGRTKNLVGLLFNESNLKGDTLKKAKQLAKEYNSTFAVIEVVNDKFTWSVEQSQTNFPFFQVQQSAFDASIGTWKVDYDVLARLDQHTARNVIAYVPAKKKSKKYLIYTAHYDHLGRMGQQAYFPGGNDNASGTAMLLELAAYYAKNPADINVVFIAFAGEEVGLLGSKYYTENPVFPLEKIAFLFNVDIMGSGEDGVTIVNATVFPEHFKQFEAINQAKNYVVKTGSRGPAANSDHYFFSEKGVPAFFMYTMGPNKHYHDVGDTYENLSFNEFNDLFHLLVDFGQVIPSIKYKAPKKK